MKTLDTMAAIFLVIGGINWGLYGIMNFDLVETVGGGRSTPVAATIYSLVALAAIYQVLFLKSIWKRWGVAYAGS